MFFSKPGEYEPCGMFSVGHFILLVLALSIVGIALSNTKNISKEKVKEIIKKSTIVLWILEIIKIIFNFAIGNWKNPNNYIYFNRINNRRIILFILSKHIITSLPNVSLYKFAKLYISWNYVVFRNISKYNKLHRVTTK